MVGTVLWSVATWPVEWRRNKRSPSSAERRYIGLAGAVADAKTVGGQRRRARNQRNARNAHLWWVRHQSIVWLIGATSSSFHLLFVPDLTEASGFHRIVPGCHWWSTPVDARAVTSPVSLRLPYHRLSRSSAHRPSSSRWWLFTCHVCEGVFRRWRAWCARIGP